jgi:hypothetical protein
MFVTARSAEGSLLQHSEFPTLSIEIPLKFSKEAPLSGPARQPPVIAWNALFVQTADRVYGIRALAIPPP